MTSVRKVETRIPQSTDFNPAEVYLVTLTRDDLATTLKSANAWGVDKAKALELIINGGLSLMREVLPFPDHPRPPEIH